MDTSGILRTGLELELTFDFVGDWAQGNTLTSICGWNKTNDGEDWARFARPNRGRRRDVGTPFRRSAIKSGECLVYPEVKCKVWFRPESRRAYPRLRFFFFFY